MRIWRLLLLVGAAAVAGGAHAEPLFQGESIEFWVEALRDPDRETRLAAAQAVGKLGGVYLADQLVDVMEQLGEERDVEIATTLAEAVERTAGPAAQVHDDPEPWRKSTGFPPPPVPDPKGWLRPLSGLLSHPLPEVRRQTCRTLSSLGPRAKSVASELAQRLTDPEPRVRAEAARALEQVGAPAEVAARPLVAALSDERSEVRSAAADALIALGPPHSERGVEALLEIRSSQRRSFELSRLLRLGAPVIPLIVRLAREEGWNPVGVALIKGFALPRKRYPEAAGEIEERLLWMLKHGDRQQQLDAILLAGLMGSDGAALLAEAAEHPDAALRVRAVVQLWRSGSTAEPALRALLKAARDSDPLVRRKAAFALEAHPPRSDRRELALPTLLDMLRDADADVRRAAASTIAGTGHWPPEAVAALAAALEDRDLAVRQTAARSLGSMGPGAAAAAGALTASLRCRERGLRLNAAFAIAALRPEAGSAAFGSLREAVESDPSEEVRWRAVLALRSAGLRDPETIRSYFRLFSASPAVGRSLARGDAVKALIEMGPEGVPALTDAVASHCSGPCVLEVGRVLDGLGPAALPALSPFLEACERASQPCSPAAIAKLGPGAEPVLRAALERLSPSTRQTATIALRMLEQRAKP